MRPTCATNTPSLHARFRVILLHPHLNTGYPYMGIARVALHRFTSSSSGTGSESAKRPDTASKGMPPAPPALSRGHSDGPRRERERGETASEDVGGRTLVAKGGGDGGGGGGEGKGDGGSEGGGSAVEAEEEGQWETPERLTINYGNEGCRPPDWRHITAVNSSISIAQLTDSPPCRTRGGFRRKWRKEPGGAAC